ncbi:Protein of unknown function (DUF3606) [Polaromonas sp. CF318]|uniref:DUF3606 domain-containing protein n=1 Tax=Polaromonas sp. CF318 TaxID=1144318 RepID=UPI000270FA1D|nr:DUF3606 domain-containing protein [Polaromonas sp. CF318]EJL78477.1 Protein of unknown function (DUF3606) [Polaromonas sp. CF318]
MSFLSHRPVVQPDRINLHNPQAAAAWEQKLHADREQLRRAIATVGDKACNVEKYLQGKDSASAGDRDKPH